MRILFTIVVLVGIVLIYNAGQRSMPPMANSGTGKPTQGKMANDMCRQFRQHSYVTECNVSGWDKTIAVTVHATGSEARALCQEITGGSRHITGAWQLQFFSPYGERPIASCSMG